MKIVYGRVKKWIPERGFGFIKDDLGGADTFVHVLTLRASGLADELAVGTAVRAEVELEPGKSYRAVFVELIDA